MVTAPHQLIPHHPQGRASLEVEHARYIANAVNLDSKTREK